MFQKVKLGIFLLAITIILSGCGGGKNTEVGPETGGQSDEKTVIPNEETNESEGEISVTKNETTESEGETTSETTSQTEGESEEVEYTGESAFEGGKVYVNKEYRYAITIPEEWEVDDQYSSWISFSRDDSETGYTVGILIQDNPQKLSIEDWLKSAPTWPYPAISERSFEKVSLNGITALKDVIKRCYLFAKGDKIYYLQRGFNDQGELTQKEWDLYEKVSSSFQFIK